MSQADVEIVRGALEAWNSGGADELTSFFADDLEWREVGGRLDRPQASGRDSLREGLESLSETWQSYRLEPEDVRDVGDRVLAVVREVARGRSSGLEVDSRWGYVITVEAGRIARVEAFRDPRQALMAVGLDS